MQKVVFVTGASSGIGQATAKAFAKAGYKVFGGIRNPDRADPISGVEFIQLDVGIDTSCQLAIQEVLDRSGQIDILINNAGVSLVGAVEATSDAEAIELFNTNLFGVLRMTRAVLPEMRQRRSGLILNVSSVLGFLPAPYMGIYASSKHAVEGLSETLDHEVRKFGIRVMLLEPSFTNTKLDTNAKQVARSIKDYQKEQEQVVQSVVGQINAAPPPEAVADRILAAIDGKYRLRVPADKRARLLSVLRRFVPAKQFDKSLRSSFGISD